MSIKTLTNISKVELSNYNLSSSSSLHGRRYLISAVAGSMPDLQRPSQDNFEDRIAFE